MASEIVMIGDLDPQAATTSEIFAGAQNRAAIASFMGAMAWEKFVKGATVGFVVGAVGAVAVGYYLRKK